uniref:uncharacterized protein LOC120328154 n=1 Tax=Styela clava TaxID=7725 RepID=UPI001939CD83|nr:uncharacterized protein LOC120328154 [Styela clava]
MQPNEMVDESQQGEEIDSSGSACGDNPKSSKPMMEKRRRARINNSLNELKTILLEALKKDTTRHSKLEKADILEMTVKYLRRLERQRVTAIRMNPAVVNKYKAGFNECRNEVTKFLSTHEGVAVDVRTRLLSHLETCQESLQDQDQDFSCDEFADQPMSWMTSPMQSDDQTSPNPKSPATKISCTTLRKEDSQQIINTGKEFCGERHGAQESRFVEREFQNVICSSTITPPSSVEISSHAKGCHADVAFILPQVGAESGFVANVPNTSSNYGRPVVFQAVPTKEIIPENEDSYRSIQTAGPSQSGFPNAGRIVPLTTSSSNLDFAAVKYLIPFTGNEANPQNVQVPTASSIRREAVNMQCNVETENYSTEYNYIPRENLTINATTATRQYAQTYSHSHSNYQSNKNPWRPWSHDNVS